MTSSIKEVARRAGVSIGTVSNVLNRPDLVSPDTRKRVRDAIAALSYVRNDSARQLRAGHSRIVAVVVLDVGNPFFTDVVRGVEAAIEGSGSMVIVCDSGEDASRESRYLDQLEEQRVRGVLITPVDNASQPATGARSRWTTCSVGGWPRGTWSNGDTGASRLWAGR